MRYASEHFVETSIGLVPAPLALAEALTYDQAWIFNRNSFKAPEDTHYQDGCSNLELALCAQRQIVATKAIGRAATIFTEIAEGDGKYTHVAGIKLDYMPLYNARLQKAPFDLALRKPLQKRLGERAKALTTREERGGNQGGKFYETIFLGLSAALDGPKNLIWPSCVREEEASSRSNNYNHDGYTLENPKVALQLKAVPESDKRKYRPEITKIGVRGLLINPAASIYGADRWDIFRTKTGLKLPPDSAPLFFQFVSELMIADAESGISNEQDAAYFELIKADANTRIEASRKRRRALGTTPQQS